MSLLSAIANRKSVRRQEAQARYVAILESDDRSAADELLDLMDLLGKTEEDVNNDQRLLASWQHSLKRYQTSDQLGNEFWAEKKALEKLQEELAVFKAGGGYDPQRETVDMDRANLRCNRAENAYRSVMGEAEHLRAMKAKHPDLFFRQILAGVNDQYQF